MKRTFLFLLGLLAVSACKSDITKQGVLVFVENPSTVAGITWLSVHMSNHGTGDTKYFPLTAKPTPIDFPTTFTIIVADSRGGDIDIVVHGMNAAKTVLANGVGRAVLHTKTFPKITIKLQPGASLCGNSQLDINEACDDGNRFSGDGCDYLCHVEISVDGSAKVDTGSRDTSSVADTNLADAAYASRDAAFVVEGGMADVTATSNRVDVNWFAEVASESVKRVDGGMGDHWNLADAMTGIDTNSLVLLQDALSERPGSTSGNDADYEVRPTNGLDAAGADGQDSDPTRLLCGTSTTSVFRDSFDQSNLVTDTGWYSNGAGGGLFSLDTLDSVSPPASALVTLPAVSDSTMTSARLGSPFSIKNNNHPPTAYMSFDVKISSKCMAKMSPRSSTFIASVSPSMEYSLHISIVATTPPTLCVEEFKGVGNMYPDTGCGSVILDEWQHVQMELRFSGNARGFLQVGSGLPQYFTPHPSGAAIAGDERQSFSIGPYLSGPHDGCNMHYDNVIFDTPEACPAP
jgi:cysteine-rich repeat protein